MRLRTFSKKRIQSKKEVKNMEKKIIRDRETGEELTLNELKAEYLRLARKKETEASSFLDYLQNITDGNGTCEWI